MSQYPLSSELLDNYQNSLLKQALQDKQQYEQNEQEFFQNDSKNNQKKLGTENQSNSENNVDNNSIDMIRKTEQKNYNENQINYQENEIYDEDKEPEKEMSVDEEEEINQNVNAKAINTTFQIVLRMANNGLQGSVLFLPYFVAQFGLLYGLMIILLFFFMSILSSILLLKSKNIIVHSNYSTIAQATLGEKGVLIIKLIVILNRLGYISFILSLIGSCLKYLIIIFNDNHIVQSYYCSQHFMIIITGIALLPFIFVNWNFKFIIVSYLRALAMVILSLEVIIIFIIEATTDQGISNSLNFFPQNFQFQEAFSSLPALILVFNYHFKFFKLYKRLRKRDDKKMTIATVYGNTLIVIIYGFIGIIGYITFGENVEENYLQFLASETNLNSKFSHSLILIVFILAFFVQIPSIFFEAKYQAYQIFSQYYKQHLKDQIDSAQELRREEMFIQQQPRTFIYEKNKLFYIVLFCLVWGLIVCISYFSQNPLLICTIIGCTFANAISFFLPAFFYLKLTEQHSCLFIGAWSMILISLTINFLCLLSLVYKIQSNLNPIDN